jgi:selenide,water dikinase
VGETIHIAEQISGVMQSALYDPQTAGGLLISIEPEKAEELRSRIDGAHIIGEVHPFTDYLIRVI